MINETLDVSKDKFYVYVLYSYKDKNFYTGFTSDLRQRLSHHARGEVKSTSNRLPLKLIHYEYFINELKKAVKKTLLKLDSKNLV